MNRAIYATRSMLSPFLRAEHSTSAKSDKVRLRVKFQRKKVSLLFCYFFGGSSVSFTQLYVKARCNERLKTIVPISSCTKSNVQGVPK